MKTFTSLALVLAALGSAPTLAQDTMTQTAPPPAETTPPADTTVPPPADTDVVTPPATTPPAEMETDPGAPLEAPPANVPETTTPPPDAATPTAPSAATTTAPATTAPAMQTPGQSMTPEQQAAYDAWPENVRTYYDGLSPSRQVLFQRIADTDKVKLAGLPAEQQETTWASIEKQDADQKANAPG